MDCNHCQWKPNCKYAEDFPPCLKAKLEYRDRTIKNLRNEIIKLKKRKTK